MITQIIFISIGIFINTEQYRRGFANIDEQRFIVKGYKKLSMPDLVR